MTDGQDGRGSSETGAAGDLRQIIAAARASKVTTQDLVLTSLREAILTGVLGPGARLRQEDLAERFGTSRIPVREALRALEYEGLVTSEPNRGFTVSELDADDVEEVYDLRIVLEAHAVRVALPLLTDEDINELETLFQAMANATGPDEQLAARERFYIRLYSVSGRPRLVGLIARLRQEVARSLRWPTLQHAPAHHDRFWEAVKEGDADRAAAQLAGHYQRVAVLIRRYLREAEARERNSADRRGR
jgi:DNA-binding GntR family transcriptional regulator